MNIQRIAPLCALALALFAAPTFAVDDEQVTRFRAENKGKIVSVLGPIDANAAGITLPHEHFFLDLSLPFDDVCRTDNQPRPRVR